MSRMTRAPDQALFFAPMLRRFADDFKAVPNHMAEHGVATTVYIQPPPQTTDGRPTLSGRERLERDRASFHSDIEHAELPLTLASRSVFKSLATIRLGWKLGRENPDAIFVMWTIVPIILLGLPLRLLRRRCVFMACGMGSVFGGDTLAMRMLRIVVRLVYRYLFSGPNSRVITHNEEDIRYLAETLDVPVEHTVATPGCGVDPREFPFQRRPTNDLPIVLVPVRLLLQKGVLDAVETSRLLSSRGVAHRMWLSSDIDPGNPSSLSRAQLETLQRTVPTVEVLGFQDQVQPLYRRCDLVLVPTKYREGLPTALIESAASGRAIVTTDNYGGNEFVIDGVTGILVDKGDAIAMADAIQALIENPERMARMIEASYRRFLGGYTKLHMLQRTVELLRTLELDTPDIYFPDIHVNVGPPGDSDVNMHGDQPASQRRSVESEGGSGFIA